MFGDLKNTYDIKNVWMNIYVFLRKWDVFFIFEGKQWLR